jgi:hypothetical protein
MSAAIAWSPGARRDRAIPRLRRQGRGNLNLKTIPTAALGADGPAFREHVHAGHRPFNAKGSLRFHLRRHRSPPNPSQSAVEPVSVRAADSRGETVSQRQRRRRDFGATAACSERQRLGSGAFPSPKRRNVKDYSDGRTKAALCRTGWWGWQDSNLQSSDYGALSHL